VIFSTHVLTDIERICDRVAILEHGRLVTEGPLDDLLARYALPLYRLVPEPGEDAGLARLATALRTVPWVDRVDVDGVGMTVGVTDEAVASRELLRAVVAAELRLASFERVRPDLEDVFLRLVGRRAEEPAA
jgi:ABC-2 type transport system ATP-binding protein